MLSKDVVETRGSNPWLKRDDDDDYSLRMAIPWSLVTEEETEEETGEETEEEAGEEAGEETEG